MPEKTNQLVEHFFRHESANLVAVLTRVFGLAQLPLVEDTVQAALVEALESWKLKGVPDNPAAWVHRVAKNKALDALRRNKTETRLLDNLSNRSEQSGQGLAVGFDSLFESAEIQDSLLRMMFACCHPKLDRQSQIALTLKVLCGFSVDEIATALLLSNEAIRKRLYRAKRQISESNVQFEIPDSATLTERLGAVHEVLYLMFNEGYRATSGDRLIREEVCEEAARLCHLLCEDNSVGNGSSRALLAMMLYHAARFDARVDADGSLVLLADQDRDRWDRDLIRHADYWLNHSARDGMSTFHLEAGILQLHCHAPSYDKTDWPRIIRLYDKLIETQPTPIYILNRAIAVGAAGDLRAGIAELKRVADDPRLKDYYLLDCAFAHLYEQLGQTDVARQHLNHALNRTRSKCEADFISARLKGVGGRKYGK